MSLLMVHSEKIDVRFKGRFKSNESGMSFEIELL